LILGFVLALLIWASVQGWRMRRKGVVSICSAWLLFGWLGFSLCVLHLLQGFWSPLDLGELAIWSFVYMIGLFVRQQEKYFTE